MEAIFFNLIKMLLKKNVMESKFIKLSLLCLMLFSSIASYAQNFRGIATYKSHQKISFKIDSTQLKNKMYQNLIDTFKKQSKKTYRLTFNNEESVFKEEERLNAPNSQVMNLGAVGSEKLYMNVKEKRYTNQNEMFGKLFLIQDQLEVLDWKLESDTKTIGDYTCYKATLKIKSKIGDDVEEESNTEKNTIVAWYTPQIPVSSGPRLYHSLPGLILEVSDGTETLLCSKIILNPKKSIEIKEPKRGEKTTQKNYDAIMKKKKKEMREFGKKSDG